MEMPLEELLLHSDAPTSWGRRVSRCDPTRRPFHGHDIPHPIGDPDQDGELSEDEDDDDEEDEDDDD